MKSIYTLLITSLLACSQWALAWEFERPPSFVLIDQPRQLAILPQQAFAPPGLPQPAEGTGRITVAVSDLLNENQEVVGVHNNQCVNTIVDGQLDPAEPAGEVNLCTHNLTIFGKGKLLLQGAVNRTAFHQGVEQTLSIVGGTGVFQRARGEVVTRESDYSAQVHIFEVYLW